MIEAHYPAMVSAYAAALLGWLALAWSTSAPWPAGDAVVLERPWRSLGAVVAGLMVVLGMGQLFVHGWLLPERGPLGPVLGAVNQFVIFAPVAAVLALRREPLESVWLAPGRVSLRLAAGAVLALLALLTYTTVRVGAGNVLEILGRILRYENLAFAAQVLMEDITIAALFVRLAAILGPRRSVALTALLFAAGHVPAMLTQGDRVHEILLLCRDAALGAAIIAVLQRSRDVLWFWCVHFALDMTQFSRITFGT